MPQKRFLTNGSQRLFRKFYCFYHTFQIAAHQSDRSCCQPLYPFPFRWAIPTSACAKAGASLIPSPTMPTIPDFFLQILMTATFPVGRDLRQDIRDPNLKSDRLGGFHIVPVIMTTRIPFLLQIQDGLFWTLLSPGQPRRSPLVPSHPRSQSQPFSACD